MAGFVCLIADPARAPLDAELAQSVAEATSAAPHWLAEAEACEFRVEGEHDAALLARAKSAVAGGAVDVCLVPAASRDVRLLVSDMDSTAITVECIDELADVLGLKDEVALITRRAMNAELDFRAALEARVALLRGLPVSVFEEIYRERVRPMPGVGTLVRTMRARRAITALVSGGFTPFVERVARDIGFDVFQANRLEAEAGRLTGRVLEPLLGAEAKLAMLMRLIEAHGLEHAQTMAVGDGANDLPMLEAAGIGVAFRAHRSVAAVAQVTIRHGDLTALLYLQGIARRDFVTG